MGKEYYLLTLSRMSLANALLDKIYLKIDGDKSEIIVYTPKRAAPLDFKIERISEGKVKGQYLLSLDRIGLVETYVDKIYLKIDGDKSEIMGDTPKRAAPLNSKIERISEGKVKEILESSQKGLLERLFPRLFISSDKNKGISYYMNLRVSFKFSFWGVHKLEKERGVKRVLMGREFKN